jgi:RimJ/RimL family protein N-acetyltransferase
MRNLSAIESARRFRDYHERPLAAEEVKYGLLLRILGQLDADRPPAFLHWTLGGPGQCAVKMALHSIVLGALDETQSRQLAGLTAEIDYPGVIGPDLTAKWFADQAIALGLQFLDPEPQRINSLSDRPRYPGAPGFARAVKSEDAAIFIDWMTAFHREAVPHDSLPTAQALEEMAGKGDYLFWIDNGQPVSMAGIVRRLKVSAAITGVYTPPELRGRGYAGSVTAAAVERIYSEGRTIACLYTDLRNPYSNRCYARIGFKPVCQSLHFHRRGQPGQSAA